MRAEKPERRKFLRLAALTGTLASCNKAPDGGTATQGAAEDEPSQLGKPVRAYGERSPHEKPARLLPDVRNPEIASSRSPLASQYGIITPAALHFERHHSGVPDLTPETHQLMIHGMVDRPLMFTVAELKRLPSESRIHFVECAGNSGSEWGPKTAPDVQRSHGLASCSEWTGVPLRILLEEAGLQRGAQWLIAEGADACKMSRSVPLYKALGDAMVVYGQNGEALRPEQGYPLRLLAPGWEGNINVKWLRRLKVVDRPGYTKDETSKYTELLGNGRARIFTFVMDAKSIITYPSGGHKLEKAGFYEINGLAWSGRGRIVRVEVSTDGGRSWQAARLQGPALPMAFTRFTLPWNWNGAETQIVSRAIDEIGYVQPTRNDLVAVRGTNSNYHCNATKAWRIMNDGSVRNVDA
ncbi:MAG: sulfite dehydrogenase [Bryobacteraceae bacterium]